MTEAQQHAARVAVGPGRSGSHDPNVNPKSQINLDIFLFNERYYSVYHTIRQTASRAARGGESMYGTTDPSALLVQI